IEEAVEEPKEEVKNANEIKPLNVVRQERNGYSITYGDLANSIFTKKFDSFVEVIVFLTGELESSETQFVGKAYKSYQTFAKAFRAGKHKNAFEINPLSFEKLANNSYCG
ncbi:hypothetical protein, partial [Staphylococcus aureus]|uniref:hypothetical protein n=1 Tax=Staphylococcus aureus TaxID=1280 RepID=UPI0020C03B1F